MRPPIPSSVRTQPWIVGLAQAGIIVGEWPRGGLFWPRLAALTLVASHLLRTHHPDARAERWVAPTEGREESVAEHFRQHLKVALASPTTDLPMALRLGFKNGLDTLSKELGPRSQEPGAAGSWLVTWAWRLGWEATRLTPDWLARQERTFDQLEEVGRFLLSRLVDWYERHVEDPGRIHPMLDFVQWLQASSPVEAAVMPTVLSRGPLLRDLSRPTWTLHPWLAAGWEAAEFAEMQDSLADIRQTAPPPSLKLRAHFYRRVVQRFGRCDRPTMLRSEINHHFCRCGLSPAKPGLNASRCYRAYHFALWVRLDQAERFGRLPRRPPTTETCPLLP